MLMVYGQLGSTCIMMHHYFFMSFSPHSLKVLVDLRSRLNKFFMHFVSELVFTPSRAPSEEIVEWLMSCVTFSNKQTREMSVFHTQDVIDPTPVLRSFLLKLFLQYPSTGDHLVRLVESWAEETGIFRIQKMAMLVDCYRVIWLINKVVK